MPPHGNFAQTKNQTKISHEIFFFTTAFFFFFVRSLSDLLILPPLNLQASGVLKTGLAIIAFNKGCSNSFQPALSVLPQF